MPAHPLRPRNAILSLGTAMLLLSGTVTVVGAPASSASPEDLDRSVLLADPGAPPGAISEADRHPVIADISENGVRDPSEVALTYPAAPTAQAFSEATGAVALPEQSGPGFSVYAIGPDAAAHLATVSSQIVNHQDATGAWQPVQDLLGADASSGWRADVGGATVRFPALLGQGSPVRMELPDGSFLAMVPEEAKVVPGEFVDGAVT